MPVGAVLVLLAAAAFVAHAFAFEFTQDDAYISLRYARNLVEGHGLVFNPGERVEGYSNFSWTLLLAFLLKLGAPPVESSMWLGVVFAVATILAAAKLARALEGSWGPASVATAVLVAGTSAFALWCTGGLETAMFAFLVTAGFERGLAPGVSARGRRAAPLLLCLAALTRPEGPLLFVLWFGIRVLDTLLFAGPVAHASAEKRKDLAIDALLFVGPLVPYALWKLWYYGDLLPNTYYAKAGLSLAYVSRGSRYAWDFFLAYGAWGVAPLLALVSLARGGLRSVEARLLIVWLGYAAYIVGIGGDVLYVHRFWLPILPIGCVLVARGMTWLAERPAGGLARRAAFPWVASMIVVLVITGTGMKHNWDGIQTRRSGEKSFVRNMTQSGQWMKNNLPPDSKIAITTIGAISYYSELVVIDMLGLTDREIARNPKMIEGLTDTWREIKYNAESILRRRPDAIMFSTGVRPSSASEKALYLYENFYESYYHHFFRSTPQRANVQIMFRVRPDAPPPHMTRVDVDDFTFLDEYGLGHLTQSRERDYVGAAEHFRRAMELTRGKCPWAKEWLGAALYDGGDPAGHEILLEVARGDPYSVMAHTRVAERALIDSNFDRAEELYRHLLSFDSDDSVPWMGLAHVARMKGDVDAGFEHAEQAIARWSGDPGTLVEFGNLALRTDRVDTAEWAYRRAQSIAPRYERARRGLEIVAAVRSGELTTDRLR